MWGSEGEFDFGDEDDVGALLAKARMNVAPAAPLLGNLLMQHNSTQIQANRSSTSTETCNRLAPTVSSSSFSIKQRAAQFPDDECTSHRVNQTCIGARGPPLTNVTNAVLPPDRQFPNQKVISDDTVQAGPPTVPLPRRSGVFKVPFLTGAGPQRKAGGEDSTELLGSKSENRQFSNSLASSSGQGDLPLHRRYDAAEKGKKILSQVENDSNPEPANAPEVTGVPPKQSQSFIPGPAGAVQRALAQGRSSAEAQGLKASSSKQAPLSLEALPDEDFSKGPWLAALEFIKSQEARTGPMQFTKLRDLRKGSISKRTAHLVVIVKSMAPSGDGDMFATVKDATGTLEGTLHRKLLADQRLAPISTGTVLVLQQVGIFRPVPRTCYLNIVSSNVLKVFPTRTAVPAHPVFHASLRATADPALAEPSWDDVALPARSNSSGGVPQRCQPIAEAGRDLPGNASESRTCQTAPETDEPLFRTSGDLERLEIGEAAECRTARGDPPPELPSQRTVSSFTAVGASGAPDTTRPLSAGRSQPGGILHDDENNQQPELNRPRIPFNPATSQHEADQRSLPSAANGQMPAGGAEPASHDGGQPLPAGGWGPNAKRGRDEDLRIGLPDASGSRQVASGPGRGPGALSVDIEQLLAGLDEEDWFLPGEEAPPPNKKTREMEESLPF